MIYCRGMNVYFSGLGGVGIGPLAEIAVDAGYSVTGSDLQESALTNQLKERGISVHIGQDGSQIAAAHETAHLDWFVYTSALPADHPELAFAKTHGIRASKRDEFLAALLEDKGLALIAVAGTHGKTSTSGLLVWALQQLGVNVSYSVGAPLPWGPSGAYVEGSKYFVYECDEFDRNFLHFSPALSLITSIDHDHVDTYPTELDYRQAFDEFISHSNHVIMWQHDTTSMHLPEDAWQLGDSEVADVSLHGEHNRQNATLVTKAIEYLALPDYHETDIKRAVESFPGTARRFEQLAPNLYSDYGHHPTEIAATLQLAREMSDHVVLVYQPHQNQRQHDIKDLYHDCMKQAETIYWLPTYLSREDPDLAILTPEELMEDLVNRDIAKQAELNDALWDEIMRHRDAGHLVLVMGAGDIDGWVRTQIAIPPIANILVLDTDNNLLLQHRDDNPAINNPGMITGFGGAVEPGESVREAALRELKEETNLSLSIDELTYLATLFQAKINDGTSRWVTYYVLKGQNASTFEIYEGQGYKKIPLNANLDEFYLSDMVRTAIQHLRQTLTK